MSLSSSASFLLLYNSALQDYTTQTGTNLVDHPFAKQLENCESVDSISSLLQENVRNFLEFRREDGKIIKSLNCVVHVLHTLSTSTVLGEGIGLVRLKPVILISYT
jgi:fungal STAND N-terminal Goodbye domain